MEFNWDLLRPEQELTEAQKSLVREIGETFLNTGTGVSDHQKKVQLGKNRNLLNDLAQLGFIRRNWNQYYPTFPALYFLSPPLRDSYAGVLHLLFKAIKALYESDGPQRFSIQRIEAQLNALIAGTRPEALVRMIKEDAYIQRATIFFQDFSQLLFVQESANPDIPVNEVIATENIFDYEDLQEAWAQEFARRHPSPLSRADMPATKGAENPKMTNKPESLGSKSRKIFVIHGRDERLRAAIFTFLRALGLEPLEWTMAIQLTGKPSPFIAEILEAAFNHAQAAVVLLSPDDEARLRADLLQPDDPPGEKMLAGQARPNVLFEAGMAFASHPNQTVLVQLGQVKPFSDVAGRHIVKMDNSVQKRQEFALKLKTAGCSVNMDGIDWHISGDLTPPNLIATISSLEANRPERLQDTRIEARIAFSRVPVAGGGPDSRGAFKGTVVGLSSPESYKMVLFALTDKWYVQPLSSNPYTDVDPEGNWENWTHLGERYAALLVRRFFKPPPTTDTLPDIGGDILAKSEVAPYGGPNPLP